MKCFTRKIEGHDVLCYEYGAGCMHFCFHLMSEVGEPYQPRMRALAKALAAANKSVIVTKDLNQAPWYADVLEKRK